jgi:hypothetical protein
MTIFALAYFTYLAIVTAWIVASVTTANTHA